jgi:rubrerythrin
LEIAAKDKIDAFAQQARVLGLPQAAAAIEAAAEDEARHGKVLEALLAAKKATTKTNKKEC